MERIRNRDNNVENGGISRDESRVHGEKNSVEREEERLENNIVAAIMSGGWVKDNDGRQHYMLNPEGIKGGRIVTQDSRDGALIAIRGGFFKSSDMSKLIDDNVPAPWKPGGHGTDEVLRHFENNKNGLEKLIIDYMLSNKTNPDSQRSLQEGELLEFYDKYKTPESFEQGSEKFLEFAKRVAKDEKGYEECVKATAALGSTLYGEQQKYWEAFKRLEKEANEPKD